MKKIRWMLTGCLGALAFLAGLWFLFRVPETKLKLVGQTSVNPIVYKKEEFTNLLERTYPKLSKSLVDFYPLPGMEQSPTVETTSGEITTVKDMDPQGITLAGDYLVVSAYSESETHNSVLWLLNSKTGKFVQTVVLSDKAHVGSIAYDPEHGNLWIANDHGSVSVAKLSTVLASDFEKTKSPLTYEGTYQLEGVHLASYMTYYDNHLYVGYFNTTGDSRVDSYAISEAGLLTKKADTIQPVASFKTLDQFQGMTVTNDWIIFSQSFGDKASHLLVYQNPGLNQWTDFEKRDLYKELVLPAYLEEVDLVDCRLYQVYESASYRYRQRGFQPAIDRIIVSQFDKLLEE